MYLLASDESHNQPPSRSTSVRQKPTTTIADVITFLQKTVEMKRVSPSMAFACLDRLKTILDHYSHRYGVPFARFPRIVLTNDNTLAIFFAFGPSRFEVEVQSEESVYYAYRGADASDELDETSHSSAPIPKWFVEHALGASARES